MSKAGSEERHQVVT